MITSAAAVSWKALHHSKAAAAAVVSMQKLHSAAAVVLGWAPHSVVAAAPVRLERGPDPARRCRAPGCPGRPHLSPAGHPARLNLALFNMDLGVLFDQGLGDHVELHLVAA